MSHERFKCIEDILVTAVESQLDNLAEINTKELGEVIDMIKDLEKAIYYCSVTKAMKKSDSDLISNSHHLENTLSQYSQSLGRSPYARKIYIDAKETHQDKTIQMKELEKYIQELGQDIIEMINGSSLEEKQYLSKKISALATKVSQLND